MIRGWVFSFIGFFVLVLNYYTFGELMNNTLYNYATYYIALPGVVGLSGIPNNILMFFNLFFQILGIFLLLYGFIYILKRQSDVYRRE